jgi:TPR repeat protein
MNWFKNLFSSNPRQSKPEAERLSLQTLKEQAAQGDAEAQNNLGSMYVHGDGVRQDYAEAIKWYRLAAAQGHTEAQNNLGSMYDEGIGVRQDFAEAIKWYQLAAKQGNAEAQYNLGAMYDEGVGVRQGVRQDFAEAVKWLQLAAAQGHAEAQYNLGTKYYTGEGVQQDYAEAVKWYRLAAKQGNAEAQNNLGAMCDQGWGVPQNSTEAMKWFQLAAAQGHTQAQRKLGRMDNDRRSTQHEYDSLKSALIAGQCVIINGNEITFNPTRLATAEDLRYFDYLLQGCLRALVIANQPPWELMKDLLPYRWNPDKHGSKANIGSHGELLDVHVDKVPFFPVFHVRNTHGFVYMYRWGYVCNGELCHRFD